MHLSRTALWIAAGLAGVLLIFVILVVARYSRDLRAVRMRIENLGSQVIETECGPIEYARFGEGYPVLVVHGNGGGFDQGMALAQGYIDPGFQVIIPSRFGYLRSPLPENASPAMQADAYACLLDSLGVPKAALFTSSAGVTSAVQFSMRHPDRVSALILHSPNAPGKVEFAVPPKPVFSALMHSDFIFWVLTKYFGSSLQALVGVPENFAVTPEFRTEIDQTLQSILPASPRANGLLFDTYVSNPEINHYPIGSVQTPTLVISAVDDPMALHENARTLAEQIPGARLLAVPNGGHLLLGHTDEVRAEITSFLRKIAD